MVTDPTTPAAKLKDNKNGIVKRLESAPKIKTAIKANTVATSKEAIIVDKFFISDKF